MAKTITLVEIAYEIGIHPKVARAKMRRNEAQRKKLEIAPHTYARSKKRDVKKVLGSDRRRRAK